MLPSSTCGHESVILRHRNTMTAPSAVELPAGPRGGPQSTNINPALSKELHCGDSYNRHSAGNLHSDKKYEGYITYRRQHTLGESSDDSLANEPAFIGDCIEYVKKSSFNSASTMMGRNDVQRQASISQMNNTGVVNPSCNKFRAFNLFVEVAIRVMLFVSFIQMERVTPFKRVVQPEELWLYKNPISKDYVTSFAIVMGVIFAPLGLTIANYILHRDGKDFVQANYAYTLALGMTGFVTSLTKISVGRLRPDFFFRCYPDGVPNNNNFDQCTGDPLVVTEGRKSFPSGHASMSFAAFGFMAFYLAAKLQIFNERGRGSAWRLCVASAPLIVAAEVAISRTCDYHHHWQDVVFGSLIGICISYLCYRQYFPSIFASNCHRSYPRNGTLKPNQTDCYVPAEEPEELDESQPLIGSEKDNKWI